MSIYSHCYIYMICIDMYIRTELTSTGAMYAPVHTSAGAMAAPAARGLQCKHHTIIIHPKKQHQGPIHPKKGQSTGQ